MISRKIAEVYNFVYNSASVLNTRVHASQWNTATDKITAVANIPSFIKKYMSALRS